MELFSKNSFLLIYLSGLCFTIIKCQVCAENGISVGLSLGPNEINATSIDHTQILHSYGEINCFGVVSEWIFFKCPTCAKVHFQIWRPEGQDVMLVGENTFDPNEVPCYYNIQASVTFVVPYNKLIPVQPGDVIGWTNDNPNNMIGFREIPYPDGRDPQSVTEICTMAGQEPKGPGFTTIGCTRTMPKRDVALRATVVSGPPILFANLPATIEIPENTLLSLGPHRIFYDVKASFGTNSDIHSPPNALEVPLTFSFVTPQPHFEITNQWNNHSDFINSTEPYTGRVSLIAPLDYEHQREHHLPIRVHGLGRDSDSTLTVKVIDLNEPHVITNLPYETNINSQTGRVGDIVFRMEVWDEDTSTQPLVFAIESTDVLEPPPPFETDKKTGILRVSEDLSSKIYPPVYELSLAAWNFMHMDVGNLTIYLIDTRDPPKIENLDNLTTIPEDSPTGSDIYQVVTESGKPSEITYSIIGVDPFEMYNKFTINPLSGWIKTTGDPEFNYGDSSQWPIKIQVQVLDDIGNDTGILTVNLSWINRPPMFNPNVYEVDIPEKCGQEDDPCLPNTTQPWIIPDLTLTLTHRDEGHLPDDLYPDTSQCSIVPGFASTYFAVDENCTHLLVVEQIDVNANPDLIKIDLTIVVEDDYGLSDTAKVYMKVFDINDHYPNFTQTSYWAAIQENTKGGTSVLTVTATDLDLGANAEIVYSLSDADDTNGTLYFQINPITGIIYTKQPIDYELLMSCTGNSTMSILVYAADRAMESKNSSEKIYITIEDVNDNQPRFECSSNRIPYEPIDPNCPCFYNTDLRSDTLAGFSILTLTATDAEQDDLGYYLLNPMMQIALNTTEGYLYINAHPLLEYHKYMMVCMVEDGGQPSLKARPPAIVRTDTFPPEDHLVDIEIEKQSDMASIIDEFMLELYAFFGSEGKGWYPKLSAVEISQDKDVMRIYALLDESTFLYENLDTPKEFVHVNELLQMLRKNLKGTPTSSFKEAMNDKYEPLLVMPTHPNWWIHTLGGVVTLCFLGLLMVIMCVVTVIMCLRYFHMGCFRMKRIRPTTHAWMKDRSYQQRSREDLSIIQENKEDIRPDYENVDVHCSRHERPRPDSSSTIHSRLYILSPRPKY